MRVVDSAKWRKRKWQLTAILTIVLLWAIGGLEGADFNNLPLAVALIPIIALLVAHLTKDWIEEEEHEHRW